MHGGTITAHSDGLGCGSEFIVKLPCSSPTHAGSAVDVDRLDRLNERRRVLVVDDNRDSAFSLSMMLRLMNHEVKTAYDGVEALEVADAFRPELMLLDIGMPRLNGYDTAKAIRERSWGQGVYLVALTGWGQDDDMRKSREAGFNTHVTKPIDPGLLRKLLDRDR